MTRILIGGCEQEVSTFNPVAYTYDRFHVLAGSEVISANRGKNSTIAGATLELESAGGIELVPTYHAEGGAAGPLAHEDFERIAREFLDSLTPHAGSVDGVYFSMHGSMGTTNELDPEGHLLERARAILGKEVPIVISLDLHGVLTARMLRHADAVVSYHTYPHVDFEDTGRRAARVLLRILRNGARPVTARVRVPTLVRGDELKTETGLFGAQIRQAKRLHERAEVLSAGFLICNPFTDVPELCSQAYVCTDGDPEVAEREALSMASDLWPKRARMQASLVGLEDAVAKAAEMNGPVAFTDAADAPSSGASGDSNAIICEMARIEYPHAVLAPIVDAPLAARAREVGVGGAFRMGVGGSLDARFTPLELDWTVQSLSNEPFDLETWSGPQEPGPTAVVTSGVFTIVATSKPVHLVDRALFFANGLDPKDFHSTVVKSPHCEPQFFDDWVEANLNVDAPGATSANLRSLGHTHCQRPMYPLEEDAVFDPKAEVYRRRGS